MQLNFSNISRVLIFPALETCFGGGFPTKFPEDDLVSGISVVDVDHELLGFVSGGKKGCHLNWIVVYKKECAILSLCQRLSLFLRGRFDTFSVHRNLAYM